MVLGTDGDIFFTVESVGTAIVTVNTYTVTAGLGEDLGLSTTLDNGFHGAGHMDGWSGAAVVPCHCEPGCRKAGGDSVSRTI